MKEIYKILKVLKVTPRQRGTMEQIRSETARRGTRETQGRRSEVKTPPHEETWGKQFEFIQFDWRKEEDDDRYS